MSLTISNRGLIVGRRLAILPRTVSGGTEAQHQALTSRQQRIDNRSLDRSSVACSHDGPSAKCLPLEPSPRRSSPCTCTGYMYLHRYKETPARRIRLNRPRRYLAAGHCVGRWEGRVLPPSIRVSPPWSIPMQSTYRASHPPPAVAALSFNDNRPGQPRMRVPVDRPGVDEGRDDHLADGFPLATGEFFARCTAVATRRFRVVVGVVEGHEPKFGCRKETPARKVPSCRQEARSAMCVSLTILCIRG